MTAPYDEDDFRPFPFAVSKFLGPFPFSVCKCLGPFHANRENLAMTEKILDPFKVSQFLDFLTMTRYNGEDSWPFPFSVVNFMAPYFD